MIPEIKTLPKVKPHLGEGFTQAYKALTRKNKSQLSYLWNLGRCESSRRSYTFEVSCDCGACGTFSHTDEVCYFIFNHAGHKIWIETKK